MKMGLSKSTKNLYYSRHQAFNKTYKKIENDETIGEGFERPKLYHHDPIKLDKFKSYVPYGIWSNELYVASIRLLALLEEIYSQSKTAQSKWNSDTKYINGILINYQKLESDLRDLYADIAEFQNCLLATDIAEKSAEISAFSHQLDSLLACENKIIETCNRKLNEISNSRVTYANLFVAIVALIISLFTLFKPEKSNKIFLDRQQRGFTEKRIIFLQR